MRLIDGGKLIEDIDYSADMGGALGKVVECVKYYAKFMVASAPTIEERKTDGFTTWEKSVADSYRIKDIIQKFHDYQVEWLKSHYDIELEPLLEEMIVRFLHDTANCYMMEEQT